MSHKDFCIYVNSQEFKEKLKLYEEAIATGKEHYIDADDLIDIAEYYYSVKNDPERTLNAAEYCLRLFPKDEFALYTLARTYMTEYRDVKRAEKYLLQVDDYMNSTEGVLIHAEILLNNNNPQEADKEFRAEYEKLRKETEEQDLYGIDELVEDDYDAKIVYEEFPLDVAMLFNDYAYYTLAEQWFSKMAKPPKEKTYEYWHTLGCIYFSTNRLEDAVDAYNKALDIDAYSVRTWIQLCDAQFQLSHLDDALQSCEYILALDPDNEDGLMYRGCCLLEQRKFNNASQVFDRVIELYQNNPKPYIFKAIISLEHGDVNTAMNDFCDAMEVSNGDIDVIVGIGGLLYDIGYKEGAYSLMKIIFEYMTENDEPIPETLAHQLVYCGEGLGIDQKEIDTYRRFLTYNNTNE